MVENCFEPIARSEVSQVLAMYAGPERERVHLDLLLLAEGNKDQVYELVDRAQRDYRDILFWAEHPEESRLDTPEKRKQLTDLFERFGLKPPASLKTD